MISSLVTKIDAISDANDELIYQFQVVEVKKLQTTDPILISHPPLLIIFQIDILRVPKNTSYSKFSILYLMLVYSLVCGEAAILSVYANKYQWC